MRILFLALDVDLSRQRGDSVHTRSVVEAIADLGNDVLLVVGAHGTQAGLNNPRVRVETLSGSDWHILLSLLDLLREFRVEVIYERRSTPKIGFALRFLLQIPSVMELNGIVSEEITMQGRRPRQDSLASAKSVVRGWMFGAIDRFVVVSQGIRDHLTRDFHIPSEKIIVLANGVDTQRFTIIPKSQACKQMGLSADAPRVVFVGNLVGWRDFKVVFASILLVLRRLPNLHLLIVGDGPERAHLEQLVAEAGLRETITFTGEIRHELVPQFVCCGDIGLLPDRQRSMSPLKLYEYLACGRPVVAFDVPGLEEVRHADAGRLVRPGDERGLSDAIFELLSSESLRTACAARGRDLVETRHSWDRVATEIIKVLVAAGGAAA